MSHSPELARTIDDNQPATPADAPLSYDQEGRLYLEWWLNRRSVSFTPVHVRGNFALTGQVDAGALEAAFDLVIRRHEMLRAAFSRTGATGYRSTSGGAAAAGTGPAVVLPRSSPFRQLVHADAALKLAVEPLDMPPGVERDRALQRLSSEIGLTPFDYEKPPLMRATLVRLNPGEHVLMIVVHHLVCDGVSLRNLMRELTAAYASFSVGSRCHLPALPAGYCDFVRWQREYLRGEVLQRLESRVQRRYEDFESVQVSCHDVSGARPRGSARQFRLGHEEAPIEPALAERIRACARRRRMSVYMVFVAALATVLHLNTKKTRVGLWGHFANRPRAEFEPVIGLFATLRLLAVDFSRDVTMSDVLAQAREAVLEANAEQLPFALLWNVIRHRSKNGVRALRMFDEAHVSFNMINADRLGSFAKFRIPPEAVSSGASDGALRFTAAERGDGFVLSARYSPDILERSGVRSLLSEVRRILDVLSQDAEARVSSLGLHLAV